jgi:hypothetical protein
MIAGKIAERMRISDRRDANKQREHSETDSNRSEHPSTPFTV